MTWIYLNGLSGFRFLGVSGRVVFLGTFLSGKLLLRHALYLPTHKLFFCHGLRLHWCHGRCLLAVMEWSRKGKGWIATSALAW